MQSPPPILIFPLHIVELILGYVAGSSRLQFDGVYAGSDEYARLLMPLSTACPNFVSPAFARIFEVLSRNPYVGREFPKVRSIRFVLSSPSTLELSTYGTLDFLDAKCNISAFVRQIRQMAPMAKKMRIMLEFGSFSEPLPIQPFSDLVAELSQHATDIEYCFECQPFIIDQQLSGLCSLAYTFFDSTDDGEQIMQLAQLNALTLRLLDIDIMTVIDITNLIQRTDGSYLQYPCLWTFRLGGPLRFHASRQPVFPGAVPFPGLRQLKLGSVNPFGDDTAFRGNAATLESLSLCLSSSLVRILREHKVFTPVSHPRLQLVSFGLDSKFEPSPFGSDVELMQFVLSIGPNAPLRTILDSFCARRILPVIPVFGGFGSIQVLTLDFVLLDLWDAIALIKALPLLSDLHARFPALGSLPRGVAKHELPAFVVANYAQIGKRFRCWSCRMGIGEGLENAVWCMLLLALACPNFDYAATNSIYRVVFMAHMKSVIARDEFTPYATRLGRLLFGGPKNEILSVKDVATEEAVLMRISR
ncbi:hypothetical protein H4218_006239 [Coemansia sp. IMI 209128]|nr:hypothetical protein H4218_006239 [Coemansia sp. IMI 209128]